METGQGTRICQSATTLALTEVGLLMETIVRGLADLATFDLRGADTLCLMNDGSCRGKAAATTEVTRIAQVLKEVA
jgi:hypothetical protein